MRRACSEQIASGPSGSQSGWRRRLSFRNFVWCFAGVTTFASTVLILLSLYARSRVAKTVPCRTDDCRYHAALIVSRLDRTLNPCRDFAAFACSAWQSQKPLPSEHFPGMTPSAQADVLVRWLGGFESMAEEGQRSLPIGDRARVLHEACLYRTRSNVNVLGALMKSLSIPWPYPPPDQVSPLGVLLNLAANWQTPLWFSVRVLNTTNTKVVTLGPGDHVFPAWRHHSKLAASNTYDEYWHTFSQIFMSGTCEGERTTPPPANDTARARPSAEMQAFVLRELVNATVRGARGATHFKISELGRMTKNISSSEWLSELNNSLKSWRPISPSDQVFASGTDVVAAIDAIFSRYTRTEILDHIGWYFADIYGPLACDKTLFPRKFGSGNLTNALVALCASQVEDAYQTLVAALFTAPRFGPDARAAVNAELRHIVNTARNMTEGASWMSYDTKSLLRDKIDSGSVDLWPPDELLDEHGLSKMYGDLPTNMSSFMPHWEAARKLVPALKNPAGSYYKALSLPKGHRLPYFDYDYVSNKVRIPLAALKKPFYYAAGTASMFYGGFGFFFTQQLVRALDNIGVMVDPSGKIWDEPRLSAAEATAIGNRSACLAPEHDTIFPEIPALEVAYAALKRSLASLKPNLRNLQAAPGFSEDQVKCCTGSCYCD
ncbi:hypothetical protein HPB48_008741 [Haemaphysalis longicornis]|uniref:Peptidase M13 N-terminal domain-containing protein n=1 Tax=Haemaphysalis longicornis TaxID=44386 RepID=A0A9J6G6U9_HAELO|nr:hypothetical protein HPB48_008741 [Haemaphysalis longicornis]